MALLTCLAIRGSNHSLRGTSVGIAVGIAPGNLERDSPKTARAPAQRERHVSEASAAQGQQA